MKKLLALVLALVMTLSLAVVGSNAAFKDAKDVNETYSEAATRTPTAPIPSSPRATSPALRSRLSFIVCTPRT